MSPEQAAIILNTVAVRSEQSAIPWVVTGDEDSYEAPYEDYTIRVVKELVQSNNYDDYTVYLLEIVNEKGTTVSSIRPHQVQKYIDNASELTGALFSNARDKALGVDKIADRLLADLGGAVPPDSLLKGDNFEDEIPF